MNTTTSRAARTRSGRSAAARFRFWLGEAYRGGGRPASKEILDEQYRSGAWRRLDTLEQMTPCIIASGYIHHLLPRPRVLDVGCGHGRLARVLSSEPLDAYLGVDLSCEAVEQAAAAGIEGARFVAADFEHWSPEGRFDVVVFLDSLYYARDPAATLRRYMEFLEDGGLMVVVMYRYSNNALIRRRLRREFETMYETRVCNGTKRWDIQLFRPPSAAVA